MIRINDLSRLFIDTKVKLPPKVTIVASDSKIKPKDYVCDEFIGSYTKKESLLSLIMNLFR